MRRCEVLIIGGGLAGCVLARELDRNGQHSVIVDRNEPVTCSKIAAGLLTPITGQRLTVAWGWHEFRAVAGDFYRELEPVDGFPLFTEVEMARLFLTEQERNWFDAKRRDNPAYADIVSPPSAWDELRREWGGGGLFATEPLGGFVMRGGARLDCARLVSGTRDAWRIKGDWIDGHVSDGELRFEGDEVVVEKWDIVARKVVLCRGAAEALHSEGEWFPRRELRPSKGEILEVRIPDWTDSRVVHQGMWLAPDGSGMGRAGSTYDWNGRDQIPTEAARREIVRGLREFVNAPVEVTGHRAAVRPTPRAYRPLVAIHPAQPRLAVFNGLGSRGALQAPLLARNLREALFHGREMPLEYKPAAWGGNEGDGRVTGAEGS
jgi:glycine oxidase